MFLVASRGVWGNKTKFFFNCLDTPDPTFFHKLNKFYYWRNYIFLFYGSVLFIPTKSCNLFFTPLRPPPHPIVLSLSLIFHSIYYALYLSHFKKHFCILIPSPFSYSTFYPAPLSICLKGWNHKCQKQTEVTSDIFSQTGFNSSSCILDSVIILYFIIE